jgi:hypothetical protein
LSVTKVSLWMRWKSVSRTSIGPPEYLRSSINTMPSDRCIVWLVIVSFIIGTSIHYKRSS